MPQPEMKKVSVLYIEDDPTAAILVQTGLRGSISPGFDVESVGTLFDARARLAEGDFDIVLLDLGLPDSEGLSALTTIRDDSPNIPIVVLTTHSYRDVGSSVLRNGADEFLEKENFDGKLLARLMVFAIDRRLLLQEVGRHQQHVEIAEVERSRLVQAVSQVDDLILITDANGLVQYANPAFERITGYGPEEIVGESPKILQSGETTDAVYEELWQTLGDGQTWRGRFVNRRKDGTLYRQESVISPIRDDAGEISGYVALGRDVTEERELEAQLRQTQKLHALGQLASGVAHDFNNTLAVILTVAGVVREDLGTSNDKISADIDEIILAARRAESVVARLLGFSRKRALRLRPLSLTSVVSAMNGMLRAAVPSTISVNVHAPEELPRVLADESAVEQIILNLVTNARDAMPMGGELRISVDEVTVDESMVGEQKHTRPGPHICVTVADTGVGIDPAIAEHIFAPFFTTKPEGEGTGLGLAMVAGLMEQQSGGVHAYSEPGMGTVFKLYFPTAVERRKRPRPKVSLEELTAGHGEIILLVEDDQALRRAGSRVLERAGYEVRIAEDGLAGLEMYREGSPDIQAIVTDMVMPRMSGRELIAQLRADGADVSVVLTSGYLEQVSDEQTKGDDRVVYLPKPWAVEDLLRGVRRALDWT